MGKFVTPLRVECVDDLACDGRGIWSILEPFVYQSDTLGLLIVVEAEFLTDFASVPRWPLTYWLFGDRAHKAAVIHDWLFHHHEVCDEETANKVLLEAMKDQDLAPFCSDNIYLGVAIGGRSAWEEDGKGNGHMIVDGRIV